MAENIEDGSGVPLKKRKLNEMGNLEDIKRAKLENFEGFSIIKVINENARSKSVFVHGKFNGSDEDAVLMLEKTPFDLTHLPQCLCGDTALKETLKNDIYSTYDAFPKASENAIKASVIYPATTKHITKYSEQERFVITETADLYSQVTLPHIEEGRFSIQWVYNILDKKTEADRIVFEDTDQETGFILLPDMKWNRKDLNALYLVAIVQKHGIRSLRDLGPEHLPLLKNILHKGLEAIETQFGIRKNKLQMFIHYQPSYFHLHVHFTHIKLEAPGFGADRAHLLEDVIQNIEMMGNYYQQKSLTYTVREQDELYHKFKENGYFESV